MTPTVSVTGVVKNYRAVRALRDVSFDLIPGRLSALVGHNGAGKTTLIKLMVERDVAQRTNRAVVLHDAVVDSHPLIASPPMPSGKEAGK